MFSIKGLNMVDYGGGTGGDDGWGDVSVQGEVDVSAVVGKVATDYSRDTATRVTGDMKGAEVELKKGEKKIAQWFHVWFPL